MLLLVDMGECGYRYEAKNQKKAMRIIKKALQGEVLEAQIIVKKALGVKKENSKGTEDEGD